MRKINLPPNLLKIGKFFLLFLIPASLACAGYFFFQYQNLQKQLANPAFFAQSENKKLLEKLGKMIKLPENESPTIATIADWEKLKDQPFFAQAKNGDKLIVYPTAKKAILFDPQTDKIIDVAPVNLVSPSATLTPSSAKTAKIALYNGTEMVGLTKIAEQKLKSKFSDLEVALRENAQKNTYEKTFVIDLTGKRSLLAEKIAQVLKGEVVDKIPAGEKTPQASLSGEIIEILAILGKSFLSP